MPRGSRRSPLANVSPLPTRYAKPCGIRNNRTAAGATAATPQNACNSPAGRKKFFRPPLADDPRWVRSPDRPEDSSAACPLPDAAGASGGSAPAETPAPSRWSGTAVAPSTPTTAVPRHGMTDCNSAFVRSRDEIDARTPPTGRSASEGNRRELALPIDKNHVGVGPREVATPGSSCLG
jgi:hypothetical protein